MNPETMLLVRMQDADLIARQYGHSLPRKWDLRHAHMGMAQCRCRHCDTIIALDDEGIYGATRQCPGGGSNTAGLLRAWLWAMALAAIYFGYLWVANH